MSYTMNLTPKEVSDLAWFADRGYDCGLYDAIEAQDADEEGYLYTIPEHKAWEVSEASKDHGAWTCLAWDSTLGVKIAAFLESIV